MIVKKKIKKSNKPCAYCVKGSEPDYKDIEGLQVVLSPKGKIVNRLLTGVCQKHQKRASSAVKQARVLAMLPFEGRL
jgi:small subunit ribosomal protein S18